MAPLIPAALAARATSFIQELAARSTSAAEKTNFAEYGPIVARSILLARDENTDDNVKVNPHSGTTSFRDINNTFVFVIFGLIGASGVAAGIWFFFWAKNGGIHFQEEDWDDYKSTVLRRKGPNGTVLSGATASTNLGGGSVYKDYDNRTEYTGGLTEMTQTTTNSTLSGITAGVSDIFSREQRKAKREKRDREREKKKDRKKREKREKSRSAKREGVQNEDGMLVDEQAEADAQDHLRAYREERAARVGGINKQAEGSEWDGSTNPDPSTLGGSDLHSNSHSHTSSSPSKRHRKAGGIRKVYSTADRNADRENERERREHRRMQQQERARPLGARASRSSKGGNESGVNRNFSYQRAAVPPARSDAPSSYLGQSAIEEEQEAGGQSYHRQGLLGYDDDIQGQDHYYSGGHNSGDIGQSRKYQPAGANNGGWVAPSAIDSEGEGGDSDLGTKSYRHHIPGLSSSANGSGVGSDISSYADEKRKSRRGGERGERRYRRGQE